MKWKSVFDFISHRMDPLRALHLDAGKERVYSFYMKVIFAKEEED
jgi:hypothetical protein